MSQRLLVVEDETVFARAVARRLGKAGFEVETVGTLAAAREAVTERPPDLVLLDMRLPDGSGMDLLGWLAGDAPAHPAVVVMTAFGDLEDAVAAMKLGALDYLRKPVDIEEMVLTVDKVLSRDALARKLDYSRARERSAVSGDEDGEILGRDPRLETVRAQIARIGALCADPQVLPPTVLILGETGTGKDLVARALHAASGRAARPFVHVDCAALPKELIESELFGHEKGAYTGAHEARAGLIEAAEDGTVFLDELGELPLELQPKLLAVLERRTLRRVGSTRERSVRAWFIAATNRDPERMVDAGELRPDLYFRLKVFTIELPPLASRGDDVLLLARHFLARAAERYRLPAPRLTPDAEQALRRYRWPGNVRELRHVLERAVLLAENAEVTPSELALPGGGQGQPAPAAFTEMTLEEMERAMLQSALEASGGNVSEAARRLGITRMAMRYRAQKYGLMQEPHPGQGRSQ